MTTTETRTTADALATLLTANTGRHLLDSGNAYGRNYERHAGKTTADFTSGPTQWLDKDGTPVLDVFHYLYERLTYVPLLDDSYVAFDAQHEDDPWHETLNAWLESIGVDTANDEPYGGVFTYNTYEIEYDLVNQGFQITSFSYGDDGYIALQIHGGCDVRGGYTRPTIFRGDIDELIGSTHVRFYCPNCEFTADYQEGMITDYDLPVSDYTAEMLIQTPVATEMPQDWKLTEGCPLCKIPLI